LYGGPVAGNLSVVGSAGVLGTVLYMPEESSASREHALLQEIAEPLALLSDDPVHFAADVEFPIALRGYDRVAVDAYVRRTSQLMAELQSRTSPQAAIRRALERVGEEVAGVLQRAHDTASEITARSRREAEERLESAREEAKRITSAAEERIVQLDADTDRIWDERERIVADARELARQLAELADAAAERFEPAPQATPATPHVDGPLPPLLDPARTGVADGEPSPAQRSDGATEPFETLAGDDRCAEQPDDDEPTLAVEPGPGRDATLPLERQPPPVARAPFDFDADAGQTPAAAPFPDPPGEQITASHRLGTTENR
jgi:hypothetical protein